MSKISSEEKALFRAAVKKIPDKPARKPKNEWEDEPLETGIPISAYEFERQGLEPNDEVSFKRPPVQNSVFQRLKLSKIPFMDVLDLHGKTLEEAEHALLRFIRQAQAEHKRCVLIVHGKGQNTQDPFPKLKNAVSAWLKALPQVLAFCSAKPEHGGRGAVYVLLGKR